MDFSSYDFMVADLDMVDLEAMDGAPWLPARLPALLPAMLPIRLKSRKNIQMNAVQAVLPGKALTFLPEMTWPAQMMIMPLQQFFPLLLETFSEVE